MVHEILQVGILECNCSIFGDLQSGQALVVDPGDGIEDILSILARHGLSLSGVAVTHAHIDHIGGAAKLKKATGAPIWMCQADEFLYAAIDMQAGWLGVETPERTEIDEWLRDASKVRAGSLEFEVLHTPGHTPGSVCLWMPGEKKLVAGDTLFRDSIGRTDLPGGDARAILRSIKDKLFPLPDETLVIPGHGPNTSLGREKAENFFLQSL